MDREDAGQKIESESIIWPPSPAMPPAPEPCRKRMRTLTGEYGFDFIFGLIAGAVFLFVFYFIVIWLLVAFSSASITVTTRNMNDNELRGIRVSIAVLQGTVFFVRLRKFSSFLRGSLIGTGLMAAYLVWPL